MPNLEVYLRDHLPQLVSIGKAWQALGARAFGIFAEDRPFFVWPNGYPFDETALSVDLPHPSDDERLGELRISGLTDAAAVARLRADAALISQLVNLNQEVRHLTADLVSSVNQQLTMYRIGRSLRNYPTVADALEAMVAEAQQIGRARGCFALFVPADPHEAVIKQAPGTQAPPALIWQLFWELQVRQQLLHLPSPDCAVSLTPAIENAIILPVMVQGELIAALGFINRPGGFHTPDLKLAHALADQMSAQIEHIVLSQAALEQTRMRSEMTLARRVQSELLPTSIPSVGGLDLYAASRPALQVGGDFFDFVCEGERPLIITVGDVTGKGLSAALLMTMSRMALRSKAQFLPYPTPADVMRKSNEDLYDDFARIGVFATVFVGQYDPRTRQLAYANAGHAPVLYRPVDGETVLLQADSTAIGILPVSLAQNQTLLIRPGDVLVIATDGFNEARNPDDELFGIERLMACLDRLAAEPAHAIAEGLFAAVAEFGAGQPQDDDQTLIVIKGVTL